MSKPANQKKRNKAAGQIRIIGGQWKRSTINIADRPTLRPTPDRLRETLFNWLGSDVSNSRCLDLYAGSGALGLEALSRRAKSVTFVDSDVVATQSIESTIAKLQCSANSSVICQDAIAWLESSSSGWDIVFVDPPFKDNMLGKLIRALNFANQPGASTWVYIEQHCDQPIPELPAGWTLHRHATVGISHGILLLVRQQQPAPG